jgi:4-oxalocrotonate tautomerase
LRLQRVDFPPRADVQPEEQMPEIFVYLLEGRSLDDKRALVKDITAAVVKNIGVPQESVTVALVETAKTDKGKGGVLFSDMKGH